MSGAASRFIASAALFGAVGLGAAGPADAAETTEGIRLSVERSRRVANDRMQATLAVEAEDQDPARLAKTINQTMAWALDRAREAEDVTVESGAYQTRPLWTKLRKIRGWHAQQELRLEAADTDRLSGLIGELQARLQLKSVAFRVSRDKRRAVEDELIDEALDAFKARAEIVRRNLEAATYRIAELHVGTAGASPPRPLAFGRAKMLSADAVPPPAFEGGTSHVTVQVNGRVVLE